MPPTISEEQNPLNGSEITSEEPMDIGEEDNQTEMTETTEELSDGPVSEPSFQNPLLKGKTPAQIEALFQSQQAAIEQQNEELNRINSRLSAVEQPTAPAPKVEEEEDDYDGFLAPHLRKLEGRLAKQLREAVAPLQENQNQNVAKTARERLKTELKHFKTLEPHVDKFFRDRGMNPATVSEDILRVTYHTVLGMANENGLDLSTSEPHINSEAPSMGIPQRRPSAAPLPTPTKNQKRPLSELEKRLARENGMTEDEYRAGQDAEPEEVVEPGFSKEGWK